MEVLKTNQSKSLKIAVVTGYNSNGKQVAATRTLGNVRVDAPDGDLLSIGKEAADLQTYPVESVKISESYGLIQG